MFIPEHDPKLTVRRSIALIVVFAVLALVALAA